MARALANLAVLRGVIEYAVLEVAAQNGQI
jgi:hypothetical protein